MLSMATAVIPVTFPIDVLPFSAPVTGPVRSTPVKRHTISPNSGMASKNSAAPRGRRERPCDACRRRKSKCVIGEGQKSCAACGVHGQDCTFIEDPQPRKRKTDAEAIELDTPKRRSTASFPQGIADAALETNIYNGTPPAKVESESSENRPRDTDSSRSEHYGTHIGPTTEFEPMLLDLAAMNGNMTSNEVYRKADARTAFFSDRGTNTEGTTGVNSIASRTIERLVGTHSPSLLRCYLATIHPNFPIVQQDVFSEYDGGKRISIDPTLLAAIYALATPLLVQEKSRTASAFPDASQVEGLALRLFGDSICNPTLSTVQAGLLLMQRPNIDSKTLNTQLVAIAHELGLHLDCSSWLLSPAEKGLRKRLAWALYMQDKWCSLVHGRPSAIFPNNWAVQGLSDEDFDESNGISNTAVSVVELDRGRELMKKMVSLTEVLSMILDTFFTLQAMQEVDDAGPGGTRLILERAKPVQIRLKDWFARLPLDLKMDNTMTGKPSSTGYLHLAYFATEITLHRCIIRSLEASSGDSYLTHICRSAAKTRLISAMDFVNRLRSEHLNSFWYFPSKVNFALISTFGCLLLATAPCQEEADFYRTRLSEYRWTLGVNSKTIAFLSFAIESLESSSTLLANLPRKPRISELGAQVTPPRTVQSISPPQDEPMEDAPVIHLGQLPSGSPSAAPSGLVSPSTSTSSGSTTYDAYVEAYPNQATGHLHR